jgi:exodeoxyribonuclease VII small subunit
MSTASMTFESAVKELEGIVARLEKGDCPLAEALDLFQRGAQLVQLCSQMLDEAQKRVEIVTQALNGRPSTAPFAPEG